MISALAAVGVESILLKGPSVARWLYDESESRGYGDIDLLVSPEKFGAAEHTAKRLGFRHLRVGRDLEEIGRETAWFRQLDNVYLELHRGFMGIPASHQEFWDELAKSTESLPLGVFDVTAQVPAVPARALLIGVHAATHGAVGHMLRDLERALLMLPDDVWIQAAGLARRLNAETALAVGLSLVPQGAALVSRLGLSPVASAEMLLNTSAAPPTAKGWEWFASTPGMWRKARFILRKLAPPPDFVRLVEPLGRRGGAWLAVAYLVRPFRLARHAPRGFLAWRAIRRRAATRLHEHQDTRRLLDSKDP